jgi:hypothetical protein
MESYYLDASRWIGTDEEFSWMFGTGEVVPVVEEPLTGEKTVSVGNSKLALRDDNMDPIGWLCDGCPVELTGESKKASVESGTHTFQKATLSGYVAEDYLK